MEIIIKTKQKFNPFFSFLNFKDVLYPYYSHLKDMILTGGYRPQLQPKLKNGLGTGRGSPGVQTKKAGNPQGGTKASNGPVTDAKGAEEGESSGSDSDSDDDGGYLHPLLMKASLKSSKPSTPEPAPPPPLPPDKDTRKPKMASLSDKKLSMDELLNLHSSSFLSRTRRVNAAPALGVATQGQASSSYGEAEALASYEHYRQQYYGRYVYYRAHCDSK